MHEVYRACILASCPVVLGRQLLPFSLWHAFALDAFDSPIMRGATCDTSDVILAAWVCSHSYESAHDKLRFHRKELERECKAWGKRVNAEQIMDAHGDLVQYIADHEKSPPRIAASGGELAIPWPLAYFWKLSGGRCDHETAKAVWNLPLPWAVAYVTAGAIALGDQSYLSERMQIDLEKARADVAAQKVNDGASGNQSTH